MPQGLAGMEQQDHAVRPARFDDGPHRRLVRYIEVLAVRIQLTNAAKAQCGASLYLLGCPRIARCNRTKGHNLAMRPQSFYNGIVRLAAKSRVTPTEVQRHRCGNAVACHSLRKVVGGRQAAPRVGIEGFKPRLAGKVTLTRLYNFCGKDMGVEVKNALAVYLHIPFCRVRCPYCDFNTYAGMQSLVPAYVEALCRVIAREGAASGFKAARTVYFGGGTPSLLEPSHVGQLIAAVNRVLPLTAECEVTLEANPVTADAGRFAGFRAAGVNRLSFGVQSLNDRLLKVLGRDHDAAQARRALDLARQAGFQNVSLDLMYAVPDQSPADWQHDVEKALALAPEHLSFYCLTVESTTPFARWMADGRIKLPADDTAADMYAFARERLAIAGYAHYEISNWALPGNEGVHNQIYWRYEPYLGLGAGAHGYLHGARTAEILAPRTYIERALKGESTALSREKVSRETAMEETIFLNLRLLQRGIVRREFATRFRVDPVNLFGEVLEELTRADLITVDKHRIRLTSHGYFLANEVCVRLMSALESGRTDAVSVSTR